MNIDWVIPCRYAEIHDNLATIVGGGIDTLWVAELPTPIQVGIVMRLLAMAEEIGPTEMHTAVSRVRDPDGDLASEVTGEFSATGEAARPEWLASIILAGAVQFEATVEGAYMVEQVVDETSLTFPIHIVHGPPPSLADE